jgi:hypothetical protein
VLAVFVERTVSAIRLPLLIGLVLAAGMIAERVALMEIMAYLS